jgi:hypothetical protein
MISFKIEPGELRKVLKDLDVVPEAVEAGLEKVANEIRARVIDATPVDSMGSPGGTLKAGWGELEKVGSWGQTDKHEPGLTFENRVPYGEILEEGLYPGVGRRTIKTTEGIFSRQAPGGIMGPIVGDQNILDFVRDLFVQAIEEVLNKKMK